MISVLDSRLRGLGSIPWQAWSLWVSATYQGSLVKCWGGGGGKTLQCTSIPSREEGGSGDTSSHFMLQKPGKGSAGWATWLEYKLFFLVQHIHCTYITLLQAFGMNPTSGE